MSDSNLMGASPRKLRVQHLRKSAGLLAFWPAPPRAGTRQRRLSSANRAFGAVLMHVLCLRKPALRGVPQSCHPLGRRSCTGTGRSASPPGQVNRGRPPPGKPTEPGGSADLSPDAAGQYRAGSPMPAGRSAVDGSCGPPRCWCRWWRDLVAVGWGYADGYRARAQPASNWRAGCYGSAAIGDAQRRKHVVVRNLTIAYSSPRGGRPQAGTIQQSRTPSASIGQGVAAELDLRRMLVAGLVRVVVLRIACSAATSGVARAPIGFPPYTGDVTAASCGPADE